jgi:hypothetical protein
MVLSAQATVQSHIRPLSHLHNTPEQGFCRLTAQLVLSSDNPNGELLSAVQGSLQLTESLSALDPSLSCRVINVDTSSYCTTTTYESSDETLYWIFTRKSGLYLQVPATGVPVLNLDITYPAGTHIEEGPGVLNTSLAANAAYDTVSLETRSVPNCFSRQPFEYSISDPGWHLLSIPGSAPDMSVTALFPHKTPKKVLGLTENRYMSCDTLKPGHGYWLYTEEPLSTSFYIYPLHEYSRHIAAGGWTLLGSVITSKADVDLISTPDRLVEYPLYSYDTSSKAYLSSNRIDPGEAYWARIRQAGSVALGYHSGTPTNRLAKSYAPPPPPPVQDSDRENTSTATQSDKNQLKGNTPNPFSQNTRIHFELATTSSVTLAVYNMRGRRVRMLVDHRLDKGIHQVVWDGRDDDGMRVSAGVYLYQLTTPEFSALRKMTLMR